MDNDFARRQQLAVEQMRQMNSKANAKPDFKKQPPSPPNITNQKEKQNNTEQPNQIKNTQSNSNNPTSQQGNFLNNLGLPFVDILLKEKDTALIIGLLLILMSENTDKILLFALIYILI